jgi:hypothetical protein
VIKGQGLRMIKDYQEAKELDRAKEIEEYIENIGRSKRQEFQEAKEVVKLLVIDNE